METITILYNFNSTWMFPRKLHRHYGICCSRQPWKVNQTGIQKKKVAQIFRHPRQGHSQMPPASHPEAKLLGFVVMVKSNTFLNEESKWK